MTSAAEHTDVLRTAPTTVSQLTPSAAGRPHLLEPYAVHLLPAYDYVQEEFLVSGHADGGDYTTRLLVRRPAVASSFSGRVLCEVSHIWGGTSVWRAYHRQLMRAGHAWVEIDSQKPSAIGLVRAANPTRYKSMVMKGDELASDFARTIPFEEGLSPQELAAQYDVFKERWWKATPQSMEIIAQVAASLRAGVVPGLDGVRTLLLAGISQTGGVTRRFLTHEHPVRRRLDGGPLFDGYLPGASGGEALPDIDVPVIEILGEAEFPAVRRACGVSGQVRGRRHRRPDSRTFRLFEIAGMAHRETRYMSDRDVARLKDCPLPEGGRWSTFPNSFIYYALLEMMVRWTEDGVQPPASRTINLTESDEIVRDEHGNATGGLRSMYTDLPTSRLIAATPVGRPSWYHGSEIPFERSTLVRLYGNPEEYRRLVSRHLTRDMDEGFLLPTDAEELRRQAEQISF